MIDCVIAYANAQEHEAAQQLAAAQQLPLVALSEVNSPFYLQFTSQGLTLVQNQAPGLTLCLDFLSGRNAHRAQQRKQSKELLVKACGGQKQALQILDATAGTGRDAYVLALAGHHVTLLERSAVISALLQDAIERLEQYQNVAMHLIQGDSVSLMQAWQQARPDVVYLDPMFPQRRKQALVKKDMQLLQQLLVDSDDGADLLAPARRLAKRGAWACFSASPIRTGLAPAAIAASTSVCLSPIM